MDKPVYSTLFIELDALLDSRASTLYKLDPEFFSNILNNKYFERLSDEFELEGYKELYNTRDRETLRNALLSEIAGLIIDFCTQTLEVTAQSPFHFVPKIIINIHPYKLEEQESNLIIQAVRALINDICDIEIVDMSYEELTPTYVKSKLTILILYDYPTWLEVHSLNKNFEKTICSQVTLFGPRVAFKKLDTLKNIEIDPFDAMEELVAPLISLKLLPINMFCFTSQYIKKTT